MAEQSSTVQQNLEYRKALWEAARSPILTTPRTSYPYTNWELQNIRAINLGRTNCPLSVDLAISQLIIWNSERRRSEHFTKIELVGMKNIKKAADSAKIHYLCVPELILKMFSDLNRVFFLGALQGNVTVPWRLDYLSSDMRGCYGKMSSSSLRADKCVIELNAYECLWSTPKPFEESLGTIFHEMCVSLSYHSPCTESFINIVRLTYDWE